MTLPAIKRSACRVLLCCLPALVVPGIGNAEPVPDMQPRQRHRIDHQQVYRLQQQHRILSLEAIINKLGLQDSDRILEVEFEREHGRNIYEIEYLDKHGNIHELEVDALSGAVLQRKND